MSLGRSPSPMLDKTSIYSGAVPPPYYEVVATVTSMVDGDTTWVRIENIVVELDPAGEVYEGNQEKVRYGGGIDAPESYMEGGPESTDFIENLIPVGTTVYLDLDNYAVGGDTGRPYRGKYERLIAVIYAQVDGQWVNINAELLRWGMEEYPGHDWDKYRYIYSEFDCHNWPPYDNDYPYVLGSTVYAHLVEGWNLISFPLASENDTPDNIFEGVAYDMFYHDRKWGFLPAPSDEPVELGVGYWVKVSENRTATTSGAPVENFSENLIAGWNLIGFPVTSADSTPDNIFAGVGYDMFYLGPKWGFLPPPSDEPVQLGMGYWVKLSDNITVTVPI